MHKWMAMLLMLCLIFGMALAEVDEPALKNPKDRYDIYFDQTDGSEELVFLMVDGVNDEAADVEAHGSLVMKHRFLVAGMPMIKTNIILQNSEFGPMIVADVGDGNVMYSLRNDAYIAIPGEPAAKAQGYSPEEFDWYWESFHFPYGRLEMLNGMRTDEAGNSYMLIKSDETMSFEFAMDGTMRIQQLRVYDHIGEGEMMLSLLVDYSVAPAVEIPEDVLALMHEDFAA